MNIHRQIRVATQFLTLAVLSSSILACSSSELSPNAMESSLDRIITRGTVTTLDSVSVNGRPFSVSNASIILDDQISDKGALRTGMQVIVQSQNGTATDIYYEEDVKGPVDSIDINGNMFVMGQSVIISSTTFFDDSSSSSVIVGDIVEVSGLRDNNGILHATFVEKKRSIPRAYEVQGPLANLNLGEKTFTIGDLLVNYSGARFDDIPESSLSDGLYVEVKDESLLYESGSMFLRATKIERYSDVLAVSDNASSTTNTQRTEIEIEAFVTEIMSDDIFRLGGLVVRILPTTRFRDGEKQQLQINTRLEVEGRLNDSGELEAWEIEFEDGSDYFDSNDDSSNSSSDGSDDHDDDGPEVELEGVVTALNVDTGVMVINGIEIRVDNRTEFENGRDQYVTRSQFFNLINIGRTVVKVEWRGFNSYNDAPHEVEIEV